MTEQEFRKLVVYSMGVLAKQAVLSVILFDLVSRGQENGQVRENIAGNKQKKSLFISRIARAISR